MELAERYQLLYFETSAKTGYNIETVNNKLNQIFINATERILDNIDKNNIDLSYEGSGIKKGEDGFGLYSNFVRKKENLKSKCCK